VGDVSLPSTEAASGPSMQPRINQKVIGYCACVQCAKRDLIVSAKNLYLIGREKVQCRLLLFNFILSGFCETYVNVLIIFELVDISGLA